MKYAKTKMAWKFMSCEQAVEKDSKHTGRWGTEGGGGGGGGGGGRQKGEGGGGTEGGGGGGGGEQKGGILLHLVQVIYNEQ